MQYNVSTLQVQTALRIGSPDPRTEEGDNSYLTLTPVLPRAVRDPDRLHPPVYTA